MAKKTVVKKPAAKKPAAKRPAVKKPAAAKPAKTAKKPVGAVAKKAHAPAAAPKAPVKAAARPLAAKPPVKGKSPFDGKSLEHIRDILVKMRERLTGQINTLSDDSLKYKDDGSSEDRTDDFDREFALNLVSSEHDALFEIDTALRRMSEGTYGLCDACGCAIEKARLHALPFARMCVRCQSDQEKGHVRFRPFGDTLTQGVEQTPEAVEAEETE
jgi:RNA polymerase-binding protein DksA